MKTFVITGATGAIGKATAIELAKPGNKLILLGRNKEKLDNVIKEIKSATANANIEGVIVDFSDITSVKKAASQIKNKITQLHGLINIAACYKAKRVFTKDLFESMFGVNHIAVFVLTKELLSLINATPGAKVLTVSAPSSTPINFSDLNGEKKFSAFTAFGASKMANLLFTFALSKRMHGVGTSAIAFHPGLTKSSLTHEMPFFVRGLLNLISHKPEKPAHSIAQLVSGVHFNDMNGKFYDHKFKELPKPGNSSDETIQERLWKVSEEIAAKFEKPVAVH
jgi:NAD(P)-dependent dehydrogenase (short-subunit alcohol dehydrogenase family)